MRQVNPARNRTPITQDWVMLGVIALAAAIVFARPARAQIEARNFYYGYSPTVKQVDVKALAETLGLDENEQQLAQAVYEGYRGAYNTASAAARDNLNSIRASMSAADNESVRANLFAEYNRAQAAWGRQSAGLEVAFFADIKDLLTREEMTHWPRYERDRRRRVGLLLAARLMPERIDLVAVLDSLELPDEVRAACEAVVDQYTIEFDAPLVERIRLSDQMEAISYAANDKGDDAQMAALQERLVRLHVKIRDLNLQYMDALASQLPPEDAGRFTDAFRKRVWPRIFGPDPVDADIRRVREVAGLTERQEEAVALLVASYQARLEPVNRELVQVEMTREMLRLSPPQSQGTGPVKSGGTDSLETVENKSQALLESRQTLVRSTLEDIRTMLTADQLRALTRGLGFGEQDENR